MESKSLEVYKSDIQKIGHTKYGDKEENRTVVVCDVKFANLEEILLREILKLYGYKIVETRDRIHDEDWKHVDIDFITDMPFDEYMALPRPTS